MTTINTTADSDLRHDRPGATGLLVTASLLSLAAGAMLTGCNTAKGVATDVSKAGESIAETSEDIGKTLTGKD